MAKIVDQIYHDTVLPIERMLDAKLVFLHQCCGAGAGGAGAEIFRPAPTSILQIHLKCYKKPLIFHTKILKLSLNIKFS
jgi:hypothetical protein